MSYLEDRIRNAIANTIEVVSDLVFADDGVVRGNGLAGQQTLMEPGFHFGFSSRPKDGAVGVRVWRILVGWRDRQYEIALQKGESVMYSAGGAKLLCDKDGNIVMNDGDKGAAREDDTTGNGTLEILGGISNAFAGLKYTAPDGTITSINATGMPIPLEGKITSSSETVRIG